MNHKTPEQSEQSKYEAQNATQRVLKEKELKEQAEKLRIHQSSDDYMDKIRKEGF